MTFLEKIASLIINKYSDTLSDTIIILPNKRSKIFLIEALKNQVKNNIFSPKIVAIEDFIQEISKIRIIDPIELLFEFYNDPNPTDLIYYYLPQE